MRLFKYTPPSSNIKLYSTALPKASFARSNKTLLSLSFTVTSSAFKSNPIKSVKLAPLPL